jgi:hypothetical protein
MIKSGSGISLVVRKLLSDASVGRRRHVVEIADDPHRDAALHELLPVLLGELRADAHQGVHLVLRAGPVRDAEGVERQVRNTPLAAAPDREPDRLQAVLVALCPGQPALDRPAPVTVQDDADVLRESSFVHGHASWALKRAPGEDSALVRRSLDEVAMRSLWSFREDPCRTRPAEATAALKKAAH